MSSPDAGWCRDPDTLDALARQTADYLQNLHGVGRRFGTTSRARPLGRRTWLHAYAECARFWFLPIEDAALISALFNGEEARGWGRRYRWGRRWGYRGRRWHRGRWGSPPALHQCPLALNR
jgi:hypothetical protein